MRIQVVGEGEVSLTEKDFVAEGGEGKVFAKGSTGYKVYHDPAKAIPLGKIQELSFISKTNIIRPDKVIVSVGKYPGTHVGHTFRFVSDTWTLCQLFPRAFRDREGFTHDAALKLVRSLQDGVAAVHQAGVLLVDLNEMNFLVSRDFATPYFIDVDSYQTAHYPATAIMPSVRDWKVSHHDFSQLSDWFSFAIVSFQVFLGMHPFKGKHPTVHGLEERMKQNISVFDPDVSIPKICFPFDVIPTGYRDWYRALFVDGKRVPPPTDAQGTIAVQSVVRTLTSDNVLEIVELSVFPEEIRAALFSHGRSVALCGTNIYVDRRVVGTTALPAAIAVTTNDNRPIIATRRNEHLHLYDTLKRAEISLNLRCDEIAATGGRLYIRNRDKVSEITFTETAQRVIAGSKIAANVLEHASRLFEGGVFQNLLGEPHVSLFPRSSTTYQIAIPELKGHRVMQAKFDSGVLMVLAADAKAYHRYVFRFNDTFKEYDIRKVENVGPADLNFITLDSGVCVCLDEQERLEVFSARKGSASLRIVEDPTLGGDMVLIKDGARVLFYRGDKVYSMRLK